METSIVVVAWVARGATGGKKYLAACWRDNVAAADLDRVQHEAKVYAITECSHLAFRVFTYPANEKAPLRIAREEIKRLWAG